MGVNPCDQEAGCACRGLVGGTGAQRGLWAAGQLVCVSATDTPRTTAPIEQSPLVVPASMSDMRGAWRSPGTWGTALTFIRFVCF